MDRGLWWAIDNRVTKRQIWLKWPSMHTQASWIWMFISFDRSRKFPATIKLSATFSFFWGSYNVHNGLLSCKSLWLSSFFFISSSSGYIISDGLYFNLMILLLDQVYCLIPLVNFSSQLFHCLHKNLFGYIYYFYYLLIVSFNSCIIFQSSLSIFF